MANTPNKKFSVKVNARWETTPDEPAIVVVADSHPTIQSSNIRAKRRLTASRAVSPARGAGEKLTEFDGSKWVRLPEDSLGMIQLASAELAAQRRAIRRGTYLSRMIRLGLPVAKGKVLGGTRRAVLPCLLLLGSVAVAAASVLRN